MGRPVFEIKGIDNLEKKLKDNAKLSDVKKVVQTNTAELTRAMQRSAPVDTGFLRRSIVMQLGNSGFVGSAGPTAEYAPYLEWGTRYMAKQPFIAPNFNKQKRQFKSDLERLMK